MDITLRHGRGRNFRLIDTEIGASLLRIANGKSIPKGIETARD